MAWSENAMHRTWMRVKSWVCDEERAVVPHFVGKPEVRGKPSVHSSHRHITIVVDESMVRTYS
jgi:hypothetical protein